MGVSADIVSVSTDQLIYLISSFDSGGEFPVYGGTTTILWGTLQTDGERTNLPSQAISGQFRQVIYADLNGIGTIPAGAGLTQGQARALFLVDQSTNIGNDLVPRAETTLCQRIGDDAPENPVIFVVDAIATGLQITAPITSRGGLCYLRIKLIHSFWR